MTDAPGAAPLDNEQIADVFDEIAALLELEGSNPFRIMAWQNAARTLRDHATPVADMVAAGEDLKALPSIGKDTAAAAEDLVRLLREPEAEEGIKAFLAKRRPSWAPDQG